MYLANKGLKYLAQVLEPKGKGKIKKVFTV
jgi:hypothetical protein